MLLPGGLGIIEVQTIIRAIADFSGQAIAPSPKPIKEMMITTRLAPIQEAQSTESNSVTSLRLAYQEAKIDYSLVEQQIKNTLLNQFNLLVQLNTELVAAAEKMSVAFDAWSDEVDRLLDVSVKVEPVPTPGLRLIDGWLYDSRGGRTLVLS
ncbi:hypothetical protein H6G97_35640 [Nostoc flagelliforme FACHB-838]|uniref:Uncharacterized protein n=1 Tax=Nostoc flagelliforme FACHB-838 TaxID=2692904 RepID=A0ABR8DZA5_9NOSO|nr:hypothetical protein [Nostoc flagelliforme]MBD2534533.1 hypothetical protein [Nostoc flagelliforme FACHB-838]